MQGRPTSVDIIMGTLFFSHDNSPVFPLTAENLMNIAWNELDPANFDEGDKPESWWLDPSTSTMYAQHLQLGGAEL